MDHGEVLTELARQVRGSTLKVLDGAKSAWLTWSPEGTSNHILWHAGHALWLQDVLCVELLTGRSELPDGWAAMFRPGSQPGAIDGWPSRDELDSLLRTQLGRMLEVLQRTPEDVLLQTPDRFRDTRTTLIRIYHQQTVRK